MAGGPVTRVTVIIEFITLIIITTIVVEKDRVVSNTMADSSSSRKLYLHYKSPSTFCDDGRRRCRHHHATGMSVVSAMNMTVITSIPVIIKNSSTS